jgi:hypothetical protein
LITFELQAANLQNFCKDEVAPFLDATAQGHWQWQHEYDYQWSKWDGRQIKRKRISAVAFLQQEDADFFLLKYPNLIK